MKKPDKQKITCDVLIAGSGAIAYLIALIFTGCNKRVAMSANPPEPSVLIGGLRILNDLTGNASLAISPENIRVDPVDGVIKQGQLGIFTRSGATASPMISRLELEHEKLVVFATKTFSNRSVIEDLGSLLTRTHGITFLAVQNGINPEGEIDLLLKQNGIGGYRLLRAIVFGGVFPASNDGSIMKHTIRTLGVGCWNASSGQENHTACLDWLNDCFSNRTIVAELLHGDEYRTASVSKAIINYLSSVSFIFGATIGEILDNPLLEGWSTDKIDECILISNLDMGLKLHAGTVKKHAKEIVSELRPHYPSMAVDGFRSFGNPKRSMDTEVNQIDRQFATYSMTPAPMNEFCSNLLDDVVSTFNELSLKSRTQALTFGVRFMVRNRVLAGLPPYTFFDVPLADLKSKAELFKRYQDRDLRIKKCLSPDFLPVELCCSYHELKSEYSRIRTGAFA
ncbi:MAG: hypothetical protein V1793_25520 [Pseudomonadota bacterium]